MDQEQRHAEPSRPRVIVLSWILVCSALANLPFAVESFTRRPGAILEGLMIVAESLPLAVAALVVRRVAPRRVTAVAATAVVLSMVGVVALSVMGGADPVGNLSLLTIAPLYCALLFADVRWATASVSAMSLLGVGLTLAANGAAPGGFAEWLMPTTVNSALALFGAQRYRRLMVIGHQEAQAALTRSIERYASSAEHFLRLRDEAEVVAHAVATLDQGALHAAFLRWAPPRFELVRGGRPTLSSGLAEQLVGAVTPALAEHLLARRVVRADDWAGLRRDLPGPVLAALAPLGRGAFAVPVQAEGAPYGFLCAVAEDPDPAIIAAVELFARQMGAAIDNVRGHRRLAERLDEVTRLQQELVHRERLAALGEAAAVVSHEVRNPLAAILNAVDLLRRETQLSPRGREVVGMVQEESLRLDALVRDLLLLARPLSPKPRPLDLGARVGAAVAVVAEGAKARRVRFETIGAAPGTPEAIADPDLLQVALVNLLQNAAQASPDGGSVKVSVAAEPGRVVLAVEDEGPGIADEVRERIFEPFFTTRGEGTGLGLAIVKAVMSAHDGAVRVGKAAKGGARFELVLPAAAAAEVALGATG